MTSKREVTQFARFDFNQFVATQLTSVPDPLTDTDKHYVLSAKVRAMHAWYFAVQPLGVEVDRVKALGGTTNIRTVRVFQAGEYDGAFDYEYTLLKSVDQLRAEARAEFNRKLAEARQKEAARLQHVAAAQKLKNARATHKVVVKKQVERKVEAVSVEASRRAFLMSPAGKTAAWDAAMAQRKAQHSPGRTA